MNRKASLLVVGLLLAASASCSKKGADARLTSLVPSEAPLVVMFPDLSETIGDFNGLMKKFTTGPAAPFVKQARSEMTRRLGFDLLEPKEWKKIGVDPAKGLALALWPAGETIVVAGVSDQKVFDGEVKKRMKELLAADQVSSSSVNGQNIVTIGAKLGSTTVPQLQYVYKGGYVLLAGGVESPKRLADTAAQKPGQSMAKAKWFTDLSKKVAQGADLFVLVNGPAAHAIMKGPEPEAARFLKEGLVATWSIAANGLSSEVFWGLDQESSKKLNQFTAGTPDAHLERYLPADTMLALKVRANAGKLLDTLLQNDPAARAEFNTALASAKEQLGVDLRTGTVENLSGNAVLGFSLGKPEQISKAIASKGRGNMGEVFGMFLWLQLKDGPAFSKLLEQALDAAGERLPATRSKVGELQVVAFPEQNGVQANLLIHKDLLGLCLGRDCPAAAGQMLTGKSGGLTAKLSPAAKKLFDQESLLVGTLKFGQLLNVLSGLDVASLGEGGMMVKVVLDMVIGAVKNLRELTAVVRVVPGGVTFKGHLQIQ